MIQGEYKTVAEVISDYNSGQRLFRNIDVEGGDFSRAELAGIVFKECWLFDSDFREANLRDAQFIGCNLKCCAFTGADLSHARIEGCAFESSDWAQVKAVGTVALSNPCYSGMVDQVDFEKCILEEPQPWIKDLPPMPPRD